MEEVRSAASSQYNRGMRSGALSHLRILDLSRVLAGPWASQVLADLGAEVIKVERPGSGDETRGWGPPWLEGGGSSSRTAAYFASTNRGKRSITIDLSAAEGQAIVRRLAGRGSSRRRLLGPRAFGGRGDEHQVDDPWF